MVVHDSEIQQDRSWLDERLFADLEGKVGGVKEIVSFLRVGCKLVVPNCDMGLPRASAHGEGVLRYRKVENPK